MPSMLAHDRFQGVYMILSGDHLDGHPSMPSSQCICLSRLDVEADPLRVTGRSSLQAMPVRLTAGLVATVPEVPLWFGAPSHVL